MREGVARRKRAGGEHRAGQPARGFWVGVKHTNCPPGLLAALTTSQLCDPQVARWLPEHAGIPTCLKVRPHWACAIHSMHVVACSLNSLAAFPSACEFGVAWTLLPTTLKIRAPPWCSGHRARCWSRLLGRHCSCGSLT